MRSLALVLVLLASAAAATSVRGVAPADEGRYVAGRPFVCDGSRHIPFTAVNDDFCDCKDGSDEPGTSACRNGKFYCANVGFIPLTLSSSRVNDGVCDCCDGSDEYKASALWPQLLCANTCAAKGEEYNREKQQAAILQKRGFQLREETIEKGKALLAEWKARQETLAVQLQAAMERKDAATADRDAKEAPEKAAKEAFDKQWDETVKARKDRSKKALFAQMDTNSDFSVSVEELAIALTRSTKIPDEDRPSISGMAENYVDSDSDGTVTEEEGSVNVERFESKLYDDIKGKFEGVEGFDIYQDETKPEYDQHIQDLIDAAVVARDEVAAAERELRDLNNEQNELTKKVSLEGGYSGEFLTLYGQCFDFIEREYKYTFCPYDKVTQSPKNGGRATSLGNWDSWVGDYDAMNFTNGEKCWNGPNRSTKVIFKCGLENKVLTTTEPNRCEYEMQFTTPAMCSTPPTGHDEL